MAAGEKEPAQIPPTTRAEENGRHGTEVAAKILSEERKNVVFLGTGEGLIYFAQLKSEWSDPNRDLVYWMLASIS